jgi:anaerobic selenocysteine-containing dehydrogenase
LKAWREYATTRPAVIRMNYGVQRSENGGTAARTIAMLPALTGAWKYRGGGGQLSTSGAFAWDKQAVERPDLALASPLGRLARVVNMSLLGECLAEQGSGVRDQGSGPAVHALFVYNSNPAAVAPNQNAVRRGLLRPDLFTVVHELFFTDTTDYADYILPATTFLEHTDVQGAYGHYFVQLSQQAIEPPARRARTCGFSANWGSAWASRKRASAIRTSKSSNRRWLSARRATRPTPAWSTLPLRI